MIIIEYVKLLYKAIYYYRIIRQVSPVTSHFYTCHNRRSLETCLDSSFNLFHHTWLCVGRSVGRSGTYLADVAIS